MCNVYIVLCIAVLSVNVVCYHPYYAHPWDWDFLTQDLCNRLCVDVSYGLMYKYIFIIQAYHHGFSLQTYHIRSTTGRDYEYTLENVHSPLDVPPVNKPPGIGVPLTSPLDGAKEVSGRMVDLVWY